MWKYVTVSLMIFALCIALNGCSFIKDILKDFPITGITIGQDTTIVTYSKSTASSTSTMSQDSIAGN